VATGATGGDGNGNGSGRTRVYQLDGNTWNQIGQDINGETAGDSSGYSLSLSDDGTILAIGAPNNGGNGINSGHVRVYKINQNVWSLLSPDIDGENPGDRSGTSVSLSADGTNLAIGAETNSDSANGSGHVRVYDLSALLSVKEQSELDFGIHPNPTKNQFTVQLETPSELQNVNIYNNLGQLILASKHRTVNTFNLESGLYIVEVTTQNSRGIEKLLIQ
jgi:hypothetical protein